MLEYMNLMHNVEIKARQNIFLIHKLIRSFYVINLQQNEREETRNCGTNFYVDGQLHVSPLI